jgi:hypothetical protein
MEIGSAIERLKEQEFYQQIQGAYQQLSPEQQLYLRWGASAAGLIAVLLIVFSVSKSANTTREEYYEKQELARVITDANDELRRLRGQSSGFSQNAEQDWKSILASKISAQGLPAESLEIMKDSPGASQSIVQESLLEIKLKNIPLRPLVQILSQMEQGSPPMKLKGLMIETGAEDGKLSAKVNVSGYLAKSDKEAGKK